MVDAGRTTGGEGAQCVFGPCVCEMCVFRYRQHSSRDKPPPPGPPVPSTHTLHKSLHPPCLLKCVCWCVCVLAGRPCLRWTGVCVPCTAALAGGNRKKTAVCVRENRKRRGRESGGPTGMPVKTVTFGVSTTISASPSPPPLLGCHSLLSPRVISLYLFASFHRRLSFFSVAVFCSVLLKSLVAPARRLYPFTS